MNTASRERTRVLVRARGLGAFRAALVERATAGTVVERRRRMLILPTRASAEVFRQTLEASELGKTPAFVLPVLATREQWLSALHAALPDAPRLLQRLEREVLMARALRETAALHPSDSPLAGARPGLVAAMLDFYDELRRRLRGTRRFVRTLFRELAVERGSDRGSESLIQQTRLFGFMFLGYERLVRASGGIDEHGLRSLLLSTQPPLPIDHVVIAVADHPVDPRGLWPSDFDLIGRLEPLRRVDVVVTDEAHDAGFRERLEEELPGLVEERAPDVPGAPELERPADGGGKPPVFVCRDREDEVRTAARVIRDAAGAHGGALDERTALVFQRPLPYLYLAGYVFGDAAIPFQAFDALPLAAEPYAALLDLVLTAVREERSTASVRAVAGSGALVFAGDAAAANAALEPVGHGDTASAQVGSLLAFLGTYETLPAGDDPSTARYLAGRSAVRAALAELSEAVAHADDQPRSPEDLAGLVHHVLESRTFAPRHGDAGVYLVDAVSARFGDFDRVHLVGLVDTEWPARTRRSVFYAAPLLKALGWPQEPDQARADQAAFRDLLLLARRITRLSAFQLEADAVVGVSPLVRLAEGMRSIEAAAPAAHPLFADEVLTCGGEVTGLSPERHAWLALRRARPPLTAPSYGGQVDPRTGAPYRVSRVDRYVACPFKYFAETVLGLAEERDEVAGLTPLERGTLLHALFERFYDAWHRDKRAAITPDTLPDAVRLFRQVADGALNELAPADAALERVRLFGSIVGTGVAERVFELEAERSLEVRERRLETVLNGIYTFPRLHGLDSRPIEIRGTADRVDIFVDGSIGVVDYKLGRMPDLSSSIQIAVYAMCASQQLEAEDGRPHPVRSAMYLAFGDERRLEGALGRDGTVFEAVRERAAGFTRAVENIEAGRFPPRPLHANDCQWCGFAGVCRKEYRVEDDGAAESV